MHPVIMAAMAFLADQPPRIAIAGALLFGLVGLSSPAPAEMRTDELLRACEGRGDLADISYCAGYLGGFNDLNALTGGLAGWSFFCPPSTGASNDQLRLVFIKWARDHPEELNKGSRATVLMALAGAFPCEQ